MINEKLVFSKLGFILEKLGFSKFGFTLVIYTVTCTLCNNCTTHDFSDLHCAYLRINLQSTAVCIPQHLHLRVLTPDKCHRRKWKRCRRSTFPECERPPAASLSATNVHRSHGASDGQSHPSHESNDGSERCSGATSPQHSGVTPQQFYS